MFKVTTTGFNRMMFEQHKINRKIQHLMNIIEVDPEWSPKTKTEQALVSDMIKTGMIRRV